METPQPTSTTITPSKIPSKPWDIDATRRANLKDIMKSGKILFPPFYHIIDDGYVCMQPEDWDKDTYTEVGQVCKSRPFASFDDYIEHLCETHCMMEDQLAWICHTCKAIFPNAMNFETHRGGCAILQERSDNVNTYYIMFTY